VGGSRRTTTHLPPLRGWRLVAGSRRTTTHLPPLRGGRSVGRSRRTTTHLPQLRTLPSIHCYLKLNCKSTKTTLVIKCSICRLLVVKLVPRIDQDLKDQSNAKTTRLNILEHTSSRNRVNLCSQNTAPIFLRD